MSSDFQVDVYPNPSHEKINVQLYSYKETKIVLQLLNAAGKIVFTESSIAKTGTTIFALNTNKLSKGIYTLNVQTDFDNLSTKVIVK